jgi:hypothetical protein
LRIPLKEGIGGEREGDFMDNFITGNFCEGGHFKKWNVYFKNWNAHLSVLNGHSASGIASKGVELKLVYCNVPSQKTKEI